MRKELGLSDVKFTYANNITDKNANWVNIAEADKFDNVIKFLIKKLHNH